MENTFEYLRLDSLSIIENILESYKVKLKYTKKTVNANKLKKEINFWQSEIDYIKNSRGSE